LGLNIDFAKFENTKVELPTQPQNKNITNHEFILIVDDGPGIDHRTWDNIYDIVYGVTKRLVPSASKENTPPSDLPADAPVVSIRFVNNHRNIPHVYNLNQIRHIFNWVTPRDAVKHPQRHPPGPKPTQTPPVRTLEYYFWNTYDEKLQKNAWVGKIPTTIILFSSSPLGNRPEDMDHFIARSAEKLNANQVPLPMMSLMVVQCNTDTNLQRQLVDTRRMITSEWFTPKPKIPPPARKGSRTSMLNPHISQPRRRPQRDWVDIVTCVEWQRGGLPGIKNVIEEEIQRGMQHRRTLQKEVALNYLSNLGKNNGLDSPSSTEDVKRFSDMEIKNVLSDREVSPVSSRNEYRTHNGHASHPSGPLNGNIKFPPARPDFVQRSGSATTLDGRTSGGRTPYYD
jgi:hypothetical protein